MPAEITLLSRREFAHTCLAGGVALAGARFAHAADANTAIVGDLANWKSVAGLDGLEVAFEFLQKTKLAELPLGRTAIDGDNVFASVSKASTKPLDVARFEAHRRYIDVQYVVSGQEMMGFLPNNQGLAVTQPYDVAKDIEFYATPTQYTPLIVREGRFAVFLPGQPHMPSCHLDGAHEVLKVVVKISADWHAQRARK